MESTTIGMIETKGLVALVYATDAMLKAAKVQFRGWRKVGALAWWRIVGAASNRSH